MRKNLGVIAAATLATFLSGCAINTHKASVPQPPLEKSILLSPAEVDACEGRLNDLMAGINADKKVVGRTYTMSSRVAECMHAALMERTQNQYGLTPTPGGEGSYSVTQYLNQIQNPTPF